MKLIALYLIDYNNLTRKEKARTWWYACIIGVPLAVIILASHFYGPSLNRIMEW